MDTLQELSQETIQEFVGAAHGDFDRVQALLAATPALLNARYLEWNETALEAASHMGRRNIAEHLLAAGAPLTICAAAMLGQVEQVAQFLQADPTLANARGAHGIPVLYHAAMSGRTEVADLLLEYGGGEGLDSAVHGAVVYGHQAMVAWLFVHGAAATATDFQGRTPLQVAEAQGDNGLAALIREHIPAA